MKLFFISAALPRASHVAVSLTRLTLCVLCGSISPAPAESPRPPNILLILADDVGREAIGCYGGESYPTPALDKLAANGLRFDHFYSGLVCHPTRVTLLSGRYPHLLENPRWGSYPAAIESQTLPNHLKKAGYATAIAGKWQLTLLKKDPQHPRRMGFDEYSLFGWHEGPRYWAPLLWQNGEQIQHPETAYGPDIYSDFLIDFIKRNGKREQPFFAYYSMALCHAVSDDFTPRPPYGRYKDRYENFGEMIVEMDRRVGRLTAALDKLGLSKNTLVLFTGDNGSPKSVYIRQEGKKFASEKVVSTCRGAPIPGAKGQYTDWGIRVPTIASWPGTIPPGQTTDALTDLTDLFPTFSALAGAPAPAFPINGTSFAPLLHGKPHTSREWIASANRGGPPCIRTRDWKLLPKGLLFNMRGDPSTEKAIPPDKDTPESSAARQHLSNLLHTLTN